MTEVFFLLNGPYYVCQLQRRKNRMAKRRGIMSEHLKEEIAKELGFYDVVEREGWGGIKARDAGNMVKRAIEMAERGVAQNDKSL
jgi:small acid-soluble spore protein F (minor alpha/beta-type SASP)